MIAFRFPSCTHIGYDEINGYVVSTVFLPPHLHSPLEYYETKLYRPNGSWASSRYPDKNSAVEAHAHIVRMIRNGTR